MVGSKDSISGPNVVLNTIVAEAFKEACDILEKADDFEKEAKALICKYLTEHQRIVFNGNGYTDEWVAEAEKRGLPNIRSMVEAIPALTTDKSVKLFEEFGVFTKAELESRAEIQYEAYVKAINIEAKTMIDMAKKTIIPAVIKYTTSLADSIISVKACGVEPEVQTELLQKISAHLKEAQKALEELEMITAKAAAIEDMPTAARAYHDEVMPAMTALRTPVDAMEVLVDKKDWPMPAYSDLIFEV